MTTARNEIIEILKRATPKKVVYWATAFAVVVFWILAVITTILYMFGYYE